MILNGITLDSGEEFSSHIKTSLRSWKRLLRNSNPTPLLVDSEKPMFQTHSKQTNSISPSVEHPRPKKLAIESPTGDTLPPFHHP